MSAHNHVFKCIKLAVKYWLYVRTEERYKTTFGCWYSSGGGTVLLFLHKALTIFSAITPPRYDELCGRLLLSRMWAV